MRNIAHSVSRYRLGHSFRALPLFYPTLQILRAASLNSAIGRGLRKSAGVGFRGKERKGEIGRGIIREDVGISVPSVRRTADPYIPARQSRMTRDGWRGQESTMRGPTVSGGSVVRLRRGKKDILDTRHKPPRRTRAARYNDPDSSFGKRSLERRARKEAGDETVRNTPRYRERDVPARRNEDIVTDGIRRLTVSNYSRQDNSYSERAASRRRVNGMSTRTMDYGEDEMSSLDLRAPRILDARQRAADSDRIALQKNPERAKMSTSRLAYLARTSPNPQSDQGNPSSASRSRDDDQSIRSTFTQTMDKRLPLSIPYTTPASEFLYGTSVVEAALRSHRNPGRKLYKMYIYTGENRDNAERDAGLERLAKKNGVQVVMVDSSTLRLMDKMSGGRPHNGYILEASPLPTLPVVSLGELTSEAAEMGFQVVVGHQSREEAAINGNRSFVRVPRNSQGQNPFVILLDSIMDPGNLGGIIRTASFLGVTAIAISTRNSASFTPIVLKASAGASENITLFSVSKPAGFIADSKLAGWKVYAAVAPSGKRGSSASSSLTTDELKNPLENDPCILMLGSEGEGLRWNLRSKADVEVAIQGNEYDKGVDSLNVSVAAGILCNAFLRRNYERLSPPPHQILENQEPKSDLF